MSLLRLPLLALTLLLLAATIHPLAAQQRSGRPGGSFSGAVSGTVVDAGTQAPIISATVAVWRAADSTLVTGAVTDVDGTFQVEGLRPGPYYVAVSYVGYVSQRVGDIQIGPRAPVAELGEIALEPDVAQLDEVQVTGERGQVQVQIDRTVYDTANDPVAAGGTATNVLETLPSVEVDVDGNVSLRGSGNVAVLINGRPAPVSGDLLASYLRQLPASTIEKVEVIPNPSAKYEPDGMGGIINIVLKQDADPGLGGTLTAGGDSQGGYQGTGLVTYGKGPWTLSGSYGFRQEEGDGGGSSYRINRYADPLTFLDQTEDEDESETSHNVNLSADYSLTPRTTLSASFQAGNRDELEEELNDFLELDAEQDPTLAYERLVAENDERFNTDARIGLQQRFGASSGRSRQGPNHELTAEARFNTSMNDGTERYTERLAGTSDVLRELQEADTERDRDELSLQLDYVRPLGDVRLETGYKGDRETLYSSFYSETLDPETGDFVADVDLNNTFDFEVVIHAAYLQLAREWGPLGVQAGLRGETALTTFTLQNTDEAFDNDYASLFPSLFFTYELDEANTLKASYSRRINRPRTWWLNPFPSFDDPLNLRVGNPELEPEYVDAVEAGYVRFTDWGSFTLTPYYRRTTNLIRRFQRLRDDGVTVRSVENFDSSDSWGLEVISSFEGKGMLEGLRGYVSLEGYRLTTDGTSVDASFQNDAFGWGGRFNGSYRLGNNLGLGDLALQANVFYRAPMDTEQGRRGAFTFINFAARQSLLNDRASLTLSLRDPFDLAGFSFEIDQPRLYQEFERRWGAQQVGLTFSYTFGQQDRRQRSRDRGERGDGGGFDDSEGL